MQQIKKINLKPEVPSPDYVTDHDTPLSVSSKNAHQVGKSPMKLL